MKMLQRSNMSFKEWAVRVICGLVALWITVAAISGIALVVFPALGPALASKNHLQVVMMFLVVFAGFFGAPASGVWVNNKLVIFLMWSIGESQVSTFAQTDAQALQKVREIMGWTAGGVHKRIDENLELLDLLQRQAPDFIESHPWVVGWFKSQDEFLIELAKAIPLTEGRFLNLAKDAPGSFPRPWSAE